MCLALPGKVVAIDGLEADVLVRDTIRKAGLQLYPETSLGEYVLVKSGLVVQVLPEAEALSVIALLDEMLAFLDGEMDGRLDEEMDGVVPAGTAGNELATGAELTAGNELAMEGADERA
ncbi:MAG: HypC/HybG/HupF family hydrogenase formation chaperone [Chloroflexota bacterium]|nr:HypC/HybG/HupF family hydrogenase formation chaperone [Chloroflexota bacterium]